MENTENQQIRFVDSQQVKVTVAEDKSVEINLAENKPEETLMVDAEKLKTFHIDQLIISTYKKIAEWHNDGEVSAKTLKFLSLELIEDIAGAAFEHCGLSYNSTLDLDEDTKQKIATEKKKLYPDAKPKPVHEMTDDELMLEIMKRRKSSV